MIDIWLWIFIGACGCTLAWGLMAPQRVYEYPFFMGAIFSAFFVPQSVSLVMDPGSIVRLESVNKALAMGSLCLLMAWIGYRYGAIKRVTRRPVPWLQPTRLQLAAGAAMIISLCALWKMATLPPEDIGSSGIFTILYFFASFATVSAPIFLMRCFSRPTPARVLLALIAGIPLAAAALSAGRRGQTAELVIFVMVCLYFARGIVIGRVLAVLGVLLAAYLIPVFGAIREQFWSSLAAGHIGDIPFSESMNRLLAGDILEFRNAAAMIQGIDWKGEYGLGTGYWDALVFRYVPGQLVGFDVKEALQFGWASGAYDVIGFQVASGSTFTAIGDTYQQFGYFGCLFFLFQGALFRNLWIRAAEKHSLLAQVAYAALIPVALLAVTHGSTWFVQGAPVVFLLLYGTYAYARRRRRRLAHESSSPAYSDY